MIAHAREEAPNECCGMIGGSDGDGGDRLPVDQRRGEPAALQPRRKGPVPDHAKRSTDAGEELLAIYHSHTGSAAYPSQTDVNLATYPDAVYVIVSCAGARKPGAEGILDPRRRDRRGRARCRLAAPLDLPALRDLLPAQRAILRPVRDAARPPGARVRAADHRDPRAGAQGEAPVRPRRVVKVGFARNQSEAELIQGLLLEEGIPSMQQAHPRLRRPRLPRRRAARHPRARGRRRGGKRACSPTPSFRARGKSWRSFAARHSSRRGRRHLARAAGVLGARRGGRRHGDRLAALPAHRVSGSSSAPLPGCRS